jgi:hypothetical protein
MTNLDYWIARATMAERKASLNRTYRYHRLTSDGAIRRFVSKLANRLTRKGK